MYGWRNLLSKNRATKRNGREISSNGKSSGSVTGKEMEKVISAVGWFEKGTIDTKREDVLLIFLIRSTRPRQDRKAINVWIHLCTSSYSQ